MFIVAADIAVVLSTPPAIVVAAIGID